MKTHSVVAAAMICVVLPGVPQQAQAHEGLVHENCPVGQTFTAGELEIAGTFTRATLPAAQAAGGYFTIENKGAAPDRLLGGSSEAVERMEVHQMRMDGDVMKMGRVEGGLEIPAGGKVALEPGGHHLMMIGLRSPFTEGECVEVTLRFEQAGEVPIVLNIGGIAADAAPEGHDH